MTAIAPALVRTFRVDRRTVTLTIPRPRRGEALSMACEWSPETPTQLSELEWQRYRAGRNAALAELGELLGESIAVIEI